MSKHQEGAAGAGGGSGAGRKTGCSPTVLWDRGHQGAVTTARDTQQDDYTRIMRQVQGRSQPGAGTCTGPGTRTQGYLQDSSSQRLYPEHGAASRRSRDSVLWDFSQLLLCSCAHSNLGAQLCYVRAGMSTNGQTLRTGDGWVERGCRAW